MKDEPQLIDLFAMFALMGVMNAYRGEDCKSAAETAYEYAAEMMKARKFYQSEGERNE